MLCYVMFCYVMWCDVMWCYVTWCDVTWCDVMSSTKLSWSTCTLTWGTHWYTLSLSGSGPKTQFPSKGGAHGHCTGRRQTPSKCALRLALTAAPFGTLIPLARSIIATHSRRRCMLLRVLLTRAPMPQRVCVACVSLIGVLLLVAAKIFERTWVATRFPAHVFFLRVAARTSWSFIHTQTWINITLLLLSVKEIR